MEELEEEDVVSAVNWESVFFFNHLSQILSRDSKLYSLQISKAKESRQCLCAITFLHNICAISCWELQYLTIFLVLFDSYGTVVKMAVISNRISQLLLSGAAKESRRSELQSLFCINWLHNSDQSHNTYAVRQYFWEWIVHSTGSWRRSKNKTIIFITQLQPQKNDFGTSGYE